MRCRTCARCNSHTAAQLPCAPTSQPAPPSHPRHRAQQRAGHLCPRAARQLLRRQLQPALQAGHIQLRLVQRRLSGAGALLCGRQSMLLPLQLLAAGGWTGEKIGSGSRCSIVHMRDGSTLIPADGPEAQHSSLTGAAWQTRQPIVQCGGRRTCVLSCTQRCSSSAACRTDNRRASSLRTYACVPAAEQQAQQWWHNSLQQLAAGTAVQTC